MVVGDELRIGSHQHIVLYRDAPGSHEERVVHHHHTLSYLHVLAAHHRGRRHQSAGLAKLPEELLHQRVVFVGVGHGVVQLEAVLGFLHSLRPFLGRRFP